MNAELYKNYNKPYEKQLERRQRLLEEQRLHRHSNQDQNRSIIIPEPTCKEESLRQSFSRHRLIFSKNNLQISEWMMEEPADMQNWILVPCPKGIRCCVISFNGKTVAIRKNGSIIFSFKSKLSSLSKHGQCSVVDGIFDSANQCIWALDLLAFGNQSFLDCECEFRFFWLKSKIEEEELSEKCEQNAYPIRSLPYISCDDSEAVNAFLCHYPLMDGLNLDGLLFYHKESHYVNGETPLVLWLLPFMIPEVLQAYLINPKYLNDKPKDYVNYKIYIEHFNLKLIQKRNKRSKSKNNMDTEECEEENESLNSIIDLEMSSNE